MADGSDNQRIKVVYTGTTAPEDVPERLELRHAPLLEPRAVEIDRTHLRELADEPVGLVLYSRNAVRTLAETGADRELDPLDRHTWWAVGQKTADLIEETFGVPAEVPDQQHFEGLSRALEEADLPGRVVSLSLEGKFRDLGPILEPRGIEFHDVPVYRTVAVDYTPPYEAFLGADWLIFTSRRGVRLFFELEQTEGPSPLGEDVRLAAIGPKTASALAERGHEPDFVPETPSKETIIHAIADTC